MSWGLSKGPLPDALSPIDPYLWWALEAGLPDFVPGDLEAPHVPLMLRPRTDKPLRGRDAGFRRLPEAARRLLRPFVARRGAPRGPGEDFVVALRPLAGLRAVLFDLKARDATLRFLAENYGIVILGPPLPGRLVNPKPSQGPTPPSRKPRVIVGIVDDGLAFAHERFRADADRTRFSAIWLQDGAPTGSSSVAYGREIAGAEIDAWLSATRDEAALYAEPYAAVSSFARGGHKPLEQRLSHGTHVLDRAGGFDPGDGGDWGLVGVQLPVATVAESSGATLAPYAVDAVKYIERVARERHPGVPLVVTFSYGLNAGPHDGTHPIERGIHDVVSLHNKTVPGKMRIVIPSGNSHLDRLHARVRFRRPEADEPQPPTRADLFWRVQPEDPTPSFVEVWLPGAYDPGGRLAVGVATPDGQESADVLVEGSPDVLAFTDALGVVCRVSFRADPFSNRGMFLIALQPSARHAAVAPVAAAGIWTIRLLDRGLAEDAAVEAWIQRDGAPFGYPPRGRQSYFDHPDYRRFEPSGAAREDDDAGCPIQRGGALNALATGRDPVVVGGLVRKTLIPSRYSAGGPNLEGPRRAPSALVTSDDSRVHAGVIGAGTRSGSWGALDGTSVAGPRAARWVAERLVAGQGSNSAALEAEALLQESTRFPPMPPSGRGGKGRLPFPPDGSHPRDRRFEAD